MGTLAKVAIGYAAARGVEKLSAGQGLGGLLGGGAQIKGKHPASATQAQMAEAVTGGDMSRTDNPMQAMMDKLKDSGVDLSAMMGGGAGGANPMAAMMQKMRDGGIDLSALMGGAPAQPGEKGGLLSSVPSGGGGLAGMMGALGGAAALQGKGLGGLLDQFNVADTAPEAEKTAALMLRAMIQAAKADGGIDKAEKAKIIETVGDDATAEDMAFIQGELKKPVDAAALAADTPAAQRMQVYSASLMTIRVDTDAEAQYLHDLATAMEIDEPTVNMLHMQMGLKPLYN
jgi:hypothetical protein